MEANVEVDSTGLDALLQLHGELEGRGIVLALARVKNDLMQPMRRYGLVEAIGEANMYATLPTAVQAYRDWADAHPLTAVVQDDSTAGQRLSALDALGLRRFARSLNPRRGDSGS